MQRETNYSDQKQHRHYEDQENHNLETEMKKK